MTTFFADEQDLQNRPQSVVTVVFFHRRTMRLGTRCWPFPVKNELLHLSAGEGLRADWSVSRSRIVRVAGVATPVLVPLLELSVSV